MGKQGIKVLVRDHKTVFQLKAILEMFGERIDDQFFNLYADRMYLIFCDDADNDHDWILVNSGHSKLPERSEITPLKLVKLLSQDEPVKPSILDGKVAIQVNNEREFKLLMEHYEGKGWKWNGGQPIRGFSIKKYPNSIAYHDKVLQYPDSDCPAWEEGYKTIPFSGFAAEVGIKVPKFIMKSEDGVDLYEGDDYHRAYFEKVWEYDFCTSLREAHAVNRKDELAKQAKAFSTKEAAESWIKEQNIRKEIIVSPESQYPVSVNKKEALILCEGPNHKDNIRLQGHEIEKIYAAYKSLTAKEVTHG